MTTLPHFCVDLNDLSLAGRGKVERLLTRAGLLKYDVLPLPGAGVLHVVGNSYGWLGPHSKDIRKEVPTEKFIQVIEAKLMLEES